jgi:hypothetical protein
MNDVLDTSRHGYIESTTTGVIPSTAEEIAFLRRQREVLIREFGVSVRRGDQANSERLGRAIDRADNDIARLSGETSNG